MVNFRPFTTTCSETSLKDGVVNFGKSENYLDTFRFEYLSPGSFSKILKELFNFFVEIFIAQPSIKLRMFY